MIPSRIRLQASSAVARSPRTGRHITPTKPPSPPGHLWSPGFMLKLRPV